MTACKRDSNTAYIVVDGNVSCNCGVRREDSHSVLATEYLQPCLFPWADSVNMGGATTYLQPCLFPWADSVNMGGATTYLQPCLFPWADSVNMGGATTYLCSRYIDHCYSYIHTFSIQLFIGVYVVHGLSSSTNVCMDHKATLLL